jgi:hypothetical protein
LTGLKPAIVSFEILTPYKAKLFDKQAPFYIQAYYAKDDSAGDPAKVALFSSLKFFGPLSSLAIPPGGEWVKILHNGIWKHKKCYSHSQERTKGILSILIRSLTPRQDFGEAFDRTHTGISGSKTVAPPRGMRLLLRFK